ncbi:OstA-like protein [Segatella oris]|uniref:OstA-like protein n=1 Tax=Segatella oris TaxID=28135 RepID=UPI0036116A69
MNFSGIIRYICGHRTIIVVTLCLFELCLVSRSIAGTGKKADKKVYLVHADELRYDQYGPVPDAQIVKGRVHFTHKGSSLWCDSAYFYQQSNSVKAFGHVRYVQGKEVSLKADRAAYDGIRQLLEARNNVVLTHGNKILYTDSLDYDRFNDYAYFFEGGRLVDGKDRLVSDWGDYNLKTREATFWYNVKMRSGDRTVTTDELHYDTQKSLAHVIGPSKIIQNGSVINTSDGYFDSKSDRAEMYSRSTVVDKDKEITGDSLFYNKRTGLARGLGNVIYVDKRNRNQLTGQRLIYNEKTGYGFATGHALVKDYSQEDTLYMHADSMKVYTFNINTDSMYRKVHCFNHVKVYRQDIQAICDSLVFNSQDSCMTMYRDPIAWTGTRQILGEIIKVYMNDSTVREAHVINQALSVERIPGEKYFNQLSSKEISGYFIKGKIRRVFASGNAKAIFYPIDDKDSTLQGHIYIETDTIKMFISPERQLEKIWTPKNTGVMLPMTQIPAEKLKLPEFAWFEELRPTDPEDVFYWRGKDEGSALKVIKRHEAPLQKINPVSR